MDIKELVSQYASHPGVKALGRVLCDKQQRRITLDGLHGSVLPLLFASLSAARPEALDSAFVFVADDQEEGGYLYHDLVQMLGEERVLFFPSSFRRAVKYGQKDAANEILRTEVLSKLSSGTLPLFVVTFPDALCELVVSH